MGLAVVVDTEILGDLFAPIKHILFVPDEFHELFLQFPVFLILWRVHRDH